MKFNLKETSEKLDSTIRSFKWMDFEVVSFNQDVITVHGGIDLYYKPNIAICFQDIFFVNSIMQWKTDTSNKVFEMIDGEDFLTNNLLYQVEQGNYLFRFKPEYYPDNFYCYFCCRSLSFEIKNNSCCT